MGRRVMQLYVGSLYVEIADVESWRVFETKRVTFRHRG